MASVRKPMAKSELISNRKPNGGSESKLGSKPDERSELSHMRKPDILSEPDVWRKPAASSESFWASKPEKASEPVMHSDALPHMQTPADQVAAALSMYYEENHTPAEAAGIKYPYKNWLDIVQSPNTLKSMIKPRNRPVAMPKFKRPRKKTPKEPKLGKPHYSRKWGGMTRKAG